MTSQTENFSLNATTNRHLFDWNYFGYRFFSKPNFFFPKENPRFFTRKEKMSKERGADVNRLSQEECKEIVDNLKKKKSLRKVKRGNRTFY